MKRGQILPVLGVLLVVSSLQAQADCYGELGGSLGGGIGGSVVGTKVGGVAGTWFGTALCGGSLLLAPATLGTVPSLTCTSVIAVTSATGQFLGGLGGGMAGTKVGAAAGRPFDDEDCR